MARHGIPSPRRPGLPLLEGLLFGLGSYLLARELLRPFRHAPATPAQVEGDMLVFDLRRDADGVSASLLHGEVRDPDDLPDILAQAAIAARDNGLICGGQG